MRLQMPLQMVLAGKSSGGKGALDGPAKVHFALGIMGQRVSFEIFVSNEALAAKATGVQLWTMPAFMVTG